ncbi:MAG: inosine/guanosine kinase [Bdellovibrio sp.]
MRFPGKRKNKHYFPVDSNERNHFNFESNPLNHDDLYVVGIDQLIVDLEANVEDAFLVTNGLAKGESIVLPDGKMEEMLEQIRQEKKLNGVYAGGSIGNTLHNFAVLADSRAVALGTISDPIKVGDEAFKYITTTHSLVDFSFLHPCHGPMGRALCLVTPDGERTFAIAKGIMNELPEEAIPEALIKNAGAIIVSSYVFRSDDTPIYHAALKAIKLAEQNDVPVIFALGTKGLVTEKRQWLSDFLPRFVNVVAMNEGEAEAWLGESDPLLALDKALDSVDLALLTVGEKGLYIGGWVDEEFARKTDDPILSKSICEYNAFEYSRAMLKKTCKIPRKIFTHINPYLGGPLKILNTNGAGDAALAALMHDMIANQYHKQKVPNSPKHKGHFLTYSSIHQISKYCNRVSFEVLSQYSPRLVRGLPEREDALEEAYWEL